MLPANLIKDFWNTVSCELQERYSLCKTHARAGIKAYRALVNKRQIGDLTYHHNPEDVAKTIAQGWASGFFQMPKKRRSATS